MSVEQLRENIKFMRNRKKLSQVTISELCGKSRGLYSHWELGTSIPQTDDLVKLSNLFGVSIDDLVRNKMYTKK